MTEYPIVHFFISFISFVIWVFTMQESIAAKIRESGYGGVAMIANIILITMWAPTAYSGCILVFEWLVRMSH